MFANNTNSTNPFSDLQPSPWYIILGVCTAVVGVAGVLLSTVMTLVQYQLRRAQRQQYAENIELSVESKVQPMQMEPIPQAILHQKEMQKINHPHSSGGEIILTPSPMKP